MTNVIPGTDYVTSPGVKSAFAEHLDRMEERKAQREANQAVKAAQKEAKQKLPKIVKEKTPKEPKTNAKKEAALKLFEQNKDKGNGEIAKMISTELEITYANAYYYVTRVFKR